MREAAVETPVLEQRRKLREDSALAHLWDELDEVKDPEIPVLSIWDLGILQNVEQEDDTVTVTITTTYSGCPAMDTIGDEIREVLARAGHGRVRVKQQLAPAWTTDWISLEGRRKLRDYGIAPPAEATGSKRELLGETVIVACPLCGSEQTEKVSEFGSTACKALYQCRDCREPFDYFKCI